MKNKIEIARINVSNWLFKISCKIKKFLFRTKLGQLYLEKLGRTNLSQKYAILQTIRTPEETQTLNEIFNKANEYFDSQEFNENLEAYIQNFETLDEIRDEIRKAEKE